MFRKNVQERLFFLFATVRMRDLYLAAREKKLEPGRDFALMGLASGLSFENFFPQPSYLRLPYFELGRAAARRLLAPGGGRTDKLTAELFQGETTRKVLL